MPTFSVLGLNATRVPQGSVLFSLLFSKPLPPPPQLLIHTYHFKSPYFYSPCNIFFQLERLLLALDLHFQLPIRLLHLDLRGISNSACLKWDFILFPNPLSPALGNCPSTLPVVPFVFDPVAPGPSCAHTCRPQWSSCFLPGGLGTLVPGELSVICRGGCFTV